MSAIVCGSKRSHHYFHEDLPSPPPLSKRHRCSSTTSVSPSASTFSPLLHLKSLFPSIHHQILETAMEECGHDLESAIKSLSDHSVHQNSGFEEAGPEAEQGSLPNAGDDIVSESTLPPSNLPVDGAEWVDAFVREMMNATSVDDAKARASRILKTFEETIRMRAAAETSNSFQKENLLHKEQVEALIRENTILKRAVAIQHERQKDFEDKNRELEQLKQLLSQYQEQLKTLEVNNYALMMHLRQAEQSNPIPGRFNPDVF